MPALGRSLVGAFSILATIVCAAETKRTEPIEIGSRLEPLFDESLIETKREVSLLLHSPSSAGKIFAFDKPWEGNISWNLTTIKDGDSYRMYYVGRAAADYVKKSLVKDGAVQL